MAVRYRLTVILAALALVASACGESAVSGEAGLSDTVEAPGGGVVDLGDLEAGFGPGSVVADAGEVLLRLNDLPDTWGAFAMPFTYQSRPEVCGVPEPIAVSGTVLSDLDPSERLFLNTMVASVEVYDTAEQATAVAQATNGPTAAECDVATLDQTFGDGIPETGIEFDLGEGIGELAENPSAISEEFEVHTRRYSGSLMAGSITRELVQFETAGASGTTVVRIAAISASGAAQGTLGLASDLLFAGGPPEISRDPAIDVAVDQVRSSLLTIDDVPEFFDPADTVFITNDFEGSPSCFESSVGEVRVDGSTWAAISPGAGVSRLWQLTTIYEDEAAAAASFEELIELGADCFVEAIDLPQDQFLVTGRAFEETEVDGVQVVLVRLDVTQFVGGQEFEIEVGFAGARTGRFTTGANFFGLIGDSPDLADLAATAAQRLASQ